MNMLGWSSEAGNPNIQDLKENWQKKEEKPQGRRAWCTEIQTTGAIVKIVQ